MELVRAQVFLDFVLTLPRLMTLLDHVKTHIRRKLDKSVGTGIWTTLPAFWRLAVLDRGLRFWAGQCRSLDRIRR